MSSTRPTIEDIAPGHPVIVVPLDPAQDTPETVWASVTDAGEEWIALGAGEDHAWRMRRDTQADGTHRFLTPEQVAWELS